MRFDEKPPRFDAVAHERVENLIRLDHVIQFHLQEAPRLGIHRGFPELLRIHFAQAFVALDVGAFASEILDRREHFLHVKKIFLFAAGAGAIDRLAVFFLRRVLGRRHHETGVAQFLHERVDLRKLPEIFHFAA